MISNVNNSAIVTSSICEPLAIVTSHWSIILTLYLWSLLSSQWRCQPGRFSMAAHRHDRRGIYRCVLLRFRGRIEIDHSYGLRCRGLCCHSRHSTRGAGATAGSTRAVPGVSAQTTPAQTVSWSIPISEIIKVSNPASWTQATVYHFLHISVRRKSVDKSCLDVCGNKSIPSHSTLTGVALSHKIGSCQLTVTVPMTHRSQRYSQQNVILSLCGLVDVCSVVC